MVWRVRGMESLTIRFGHVTGWWAGVGVPVAGLRAGVWVGIRVRVHRAESKGSGRGRPVGGGLAFFGVRELGTSSVRSMTVEP